MWALEYDRTAAVQAIVVADPHPDHFRMGTKGAGLTALYMAVMGTNGAGGPRIVEILVKADPSGDHLNKKGGYPGETPLAGAIYQGGYYKRSGGEHGVAGADECAAILRAAGALEYANHLPNNVNPNP